MQPARLLTAESREARKAHGTAAPSNAIGWSQAMLARRRVDEQKSRLKDAKVDRHSSRLSRNLWRAQQTGLALWTTR
jgi:hypothetical protein